VSAPGAEREASLLARVPVGARLDGGAVLDRFLAWVRDEGLEPYAAQEEALLELVTGRHVVLSTPTGSGKSLVALGLHFKALCEGRRSFYTAPIKALVSEKFFQLCGYFGPENVGMLTGDASINWGAPILCCTAEILANMSVRQGEAADAPYVVMDEFHYYGDRDRGIAWQLPLLTLPRTQFLLMSATLGNTRHIEEALRKRSGREVAHVWSDERPVPLDYEYAETPLHETVEKLLESGRAPVYVVLFTQREAAEQAQALTSARICDKAHKGRLREAIGDFRFASPYGRDMKRFLSHGIGLHHAGLLPRYRLLVEKLAQQSLLRVICGTDTLGMGVNIPIRTVLFSKLVKFDGTETAVLKVRDFQQIAGRAGRRGFDERGSVVCQGPAHVIENKRRAARGRGAGGRPGRRKVHRKGPPAGPTWTDKTFRQLRERPPETLKSRFRIHHGLLIDCLRSERTEERGYRRLVEIIGRCHEDDAHKRRLLRESAVLFRALRRAGVVHVVPGPGGGTVSVDESLQREFSLHQTLSLFLVEAVGELDREDPDYVLDLLSLVEAILENPRQVLYAQERRARAELLAQLKAQGVPYEERGPKLDAVTWPKPNAEWIYKSFDDFAARHPWVGTENIRLKSVAREMYERFATFDDYVRREGIARIEGLLLRYLGQVHGVLTRSVPESAKTEDVHELVGYLRATIGRVDSSLLDEWESLMRPGGRAPERPEPAPRPPWEDPKRLRARIRSEVHLLVGALAEASYEAAARCVFPDPDDPWDAERLRAAMEPFHAAYGRLRFDPEARLAHWTRIEPAGDRRYRVVQTLLDEAEDHFWCLEADVDLTQPPAPETPWLRLRRIGT